MRITVYTGLTDYVAHSESPYLLITNRNLVITSSGPLVNNFQPSLSLLFNLRGYSAIHKQCPRRRIYAVAIGELQRVWSVEGVGENVTDSSHAAAVEAEEGFALFYRKLQRMIYLTG